MKRILTSIIAFVCFSGFVSFALAKENLKQTIYYVSDESGKDTNPGTEEAPFKTIQRAITSLRAGDICYLKQGIYRQSVSVKGKFGTLNNPIQIMAYPGDTVQINGTDILNSQWTQFEGNIYKTTLTRDIWQLFVNGGMKTSARWPNAEAWSKKMWDRDQSWGHQHENSVFGKMIDDGKMNLAGQSVDFTGAIAILNVGSWLSFAEKVTSHGGSSNTFTYSTNFKENQYHHKKSHGSYFIEASLACLDAPNEWYYNPTTQELFLYTQNGISPEEQIVEGKTRTYGIEVSNSKFIQFKNIDFWACTVKFSGSQNCKLENSQVEFPSYSKRMLGELQKAEPTVINGGNSQKFSGNVIRNCTFRYADGTGIEIIGKQDTIENCLFYQIDYSCVGSLHDVLINARQARQLTFRFNSLSTAGNSVGIKMGMANTISYNVVSNQGLLQNDGAAIQADASESDGAVMSYNWVHNTVKFGLRFDSPWLNPEIYGTNGKMLYNVVWNSSPIIPKGDYHHVYNNTSFNNNGFDLSLFSDVTHGGISDHTIARNNAVNIISGANANKVTSYRGIVENCWIGAELSPQQNIQDLLNDPNNYDFRPKAGSALIDAGYYQKGITDRYIGDTPDIGAYEFGDSLYSIPGRKEIFATHPIPRNHSFTNGEFVDLMWRQGFEALTHRVYLGTTKSSVDNATESSLTYLGEYKNNVVYPGELEKGQTYFWRVDVVYPDKTVKGITWNFQAGKDANKQVTGSAGPVLRKQMKVWPVPGDDILFVEVPATTDGTIEIIDISGKIQIKKQTHSQARVSIDTSSLKSGYYMLRLMHSVEKILIR